MFVLVLIVAVPDRLLPQEQPLRVPSSSVPASELARRESLARYGVAILRARDRLPVEALAESEAAVRLAPDAVEPLRALIPLYIELGREPAAIRTARRILELDPDDSSTAHRLGQLLYEGKNYSSAVIVLKQAADSPRVADEPVRRFGILRDLARAAESASDWTTVESATAQALMLAEHSGERLAQASVFDSPRDFYRQLVVVQEQRGRAQTALKQYSEAIASFTQAAKRAANPMTANDPAAAARLALHLAEVYQSRGEPGAAVEALEQFLAYGPKSPEPYVQYVKLLRACGRGSAVPSQLDALVRAHPNVEAIRWIQLLEQPQSNPGRIRTVARTTTDPAFYPLLVRHLRKTSQPGELLMIADQLYQDARGPELAQPNAPRPPAWPETVARSRAFTTAVFNEPGLTVMLLREVGELNPDQPHSSDTWELIGRLARRDRQIIAAERAFRQAIRAGENRDAAAQLLELLSEQHQWAELRAECLRLIAAVGRGRSHPLLYDIYLGRALAELGRGDEALRAVSNLGVSAQGLVWSRLQRVRLLNLLNRHAEAIRECEAILIDHPSPGDATSVRYQLAEAYAGQKQYERAEAELRAVLDHDPDDVLALNNLGYNLADQGRKLAEAENLVRRAIELDRAERRKLGDPEPESGVYLDSLAWVLFRRGKLAEAKELLERATRLPDSAADAVVWDHLGDVAFRLTDPTRAREAWSKAASLYENSLLAKESGRLDEVRRKLKLVPFP